MSTSSYSSARPSPPKDSVYFLQVQRTKRVTELAGTVEYPDLTIVDVAVLILLNIFADKKTGGNIRASVETIARMGNCAHRTVQRSFVKLERVGLLEREGTPRPRAIVSYRLGPPILVPPLPSIREAQNAKPPRRKSGVSESPALASVSRMSNDALASLGHATSVSESPALASLGPDDRQSSVSESSNWRHRDLQNQLITNSNEPIKGTYREPTTADKPDHANQGLAALVPLASLAGQNDDDEDVLAFFRRYLNTGARPD